MPATRSRALVLGHDKKLALLAMTRFEDTHEFVRLHAATASPTPPVGPELLRAVDRVMSDRPFSAVVATSESAMLAAGFVRSQYGLPGLGYEQVLIATNKWRMRTALRSVVRSPRAWLSGKFLRDEPPVPPEMAEVVIKPMASSAARGVRRMPIAQARAWLAARDDLWLVEEAVETQREFHCDGVFHEGRLSWAEASEYDRPVLRSHGTRSTSILRRNDSLRSALIDRSNRVVGGLGCREGVFHMEFLFDGTELFFGEVGLRPAGTGIAELIGIATGADLWASFVAAQLGRGSDGFSPKRQAADITGLIMARPTADGRLPLPAHKVRGLPGVVELGEGNLMRGAQPANMCEFEYLAFFEGLTREEIARVRQTVADVDVRPAGDDRRV
ncbi:hypothetical protein AB0M50_29420 [Nonomuraea fuscirosea]|uniref:ATP-grasp domain-containing protein n=1 Tax=Nonomuraea fuscirosea TaxID=1291556 RepID=UPI00342F63F5